MKIYNVYVYNTYSTDENDEGIGVDYTFVGGFRETPSNLVLDAIWKQEAQKIVARNEGVSYVEKDRTLTFHCDNSFDVNDYELIIQEDDTTGVEDEDDWEE